jgi:hypothetical protein
MGTQQVIKCQYCGTDHSKALDDQSCLKALLQRAYYMDYRYSLHDESHPLAKVNRRKKGLVDIARHIVSVRRGTWLQAGEIVRFIDGDGHNFMRNNLLVVTRSTLAAIRSPKANLNCAVCNTPFTESQSHAARRSTCSVECSAIFRRKFDVTADELQVMIWDTSTTQVAATFDVSDKAVEKRCVKFGIIKPPRGYWRLIETGVDHAVALLRLKWKAEQIEELDKILVRAENKNRQ